MAVKVEASTEEEAEDTAANLKLLFLTLRGA
jgi:hypothetical protein